MDEYVQKNSLAGFINHKQRNAMLYSVEIYTQS